MDKITIKQAVKTAEELKYSDTVIDKIKKAKSEYEISRILASARKEMKSQEDIYETLNKYYCVDLLQRNRGICD